MSRGTNPRYWWCVTLNNGAFEHQHARDDFVERWRDYLEEDEDHNLTQGIGYYCFQFEKEGHDHIQMTLYFKPKVRFTSVQHWFAQFNYPGCTAPHIEPCENPSASIEYCKKERTRTQGPYEGGVCPKDGKSSALVRASVLLREGRPMREIAQTFPAEFVRHHRGLQALAHILQEPEDEGAPPSPPDVRLYFGPSGKGKSTLARTWREPGQRCYVFPVGDTLWSDGYAGQELVVLDEFHGQFPLDQLLRLLDGFPVRVPCKGSFNWFQPKRVAITSTSDPGSWYCYAGRLDRFPALLRRITSLALWFSTSPHGEPIIYEGEDLADWKRLLVPRLERPAA